MRLRNLTRRREIGANCYLIEHGNQRIVLDSGMHPKEAGFDALPDYGPLAHDSANAIFITHAHHDHIGSMPVLQRRQPNTPVLMTEFTGEVGSAMLHNSVNVMTSQREELGITEYPFFTHRELDEIRAQWIYRDIGRPFEVPDTDMTATLHDAGHIVGSAGVTLRQNGATLFYTGDVNFEPQTISMAADFPTEGVDVLMLETTRGTHQRPESYSRKGEKERLAAVIRETYDAGGSVLIPVFALGKTQEVMLMLHELHHEGLIPDLPLHIGGLATKITLLFDHYASRTRRNYPGFRLMQDIEIFVAPQGRRRQVTYEPGAIFALSSGMMSEGTTSNQFAQTFLDNPRNSIAFVGYTDPDSPGYRVRHAQPGEAVRLSEKAAPVTMRCRLENFDLSAHATREALAEYAEKLRPAKLVLVHGEVPAQEWFANRFRDTLPGTEIIRPESHVPIDLW